MHAPVKRVAVREVVSGTDFVSLHGHEQPVQVVAATPVAPDPSGKKRVGVKG